MKPTRACLVQVVLAAAVATPAFAQDSPAPRPTVAVAQFETDRTGWVPPPQLGVTLAELLGDRLVESGQYRVLDGSWLKPFSLSCREPDAGSQPNVSRSKPALPCAEVRTTLAGPDEHDRPLSAAALRERAGRAGVDYLVLGSVTRFSTENRRRTVGAILPMLLAGGGRRTESVIGLTVRVVDVRSGEIVATATTQGKSSRRNVSLGGISPLRGRVGVGALGVASVASESRDALLDEALQEAIMDIAEALINAAPRMGRT